MKHFKDIGFVIKIKDTNEKDKIITIFTKNHGKIVCIAKGIKSLQSRKRGNIDLFFLSKFLFYEGKTFNIITEVKIDNDFRILRQEKIGYFLLFYLSEILYFLLPDEIQYKNIFSDIEILLSNINWKSPFLQLICFNLRLLNSLGYSPNFTSCIRCNKNLKINEKRSVSFDEIGFVCCKLSKNINISDKELKSLKYLNNSSFVKASYLNLSIQEKIKLFQVTNKWFSYITQRTLKSPSLLIKEF